MRKPVFCICEKIGAYELRSNCADDQHICFPFTDTIITGRTPEDRISRDAAHYYVHIDAAHHYKNTPMQHTAIFHGCKMTIFGLNFFDYFHIFAQNIYCGYTLEPPH